MHRHTYAVLVRIISRVCNGDQRSITIEYFAVLLRAFRRDPRDQAELVAARCMDARVGPGADLVEISIKGQVPAQTGSRPELPDVELSHETERAFAWLRRKRKGKRKAESGKPDGMVEGRRNSWRR